MKKSPSILARAFVMDRATFRAYEALRDGDVQATTRRQWHGGRKRLPIEEKQSYKIAFLIDQQLPRFQRGFKALQQLKRSGTWNYESLSDALSKQFKPKEIAALLAARTPMRAAKRFVAELQGKTLETIQSQYSRYVSSKRKSRSCVR